jgi:hypothetical protein
MGGNYLLVGDNHLEVNGGNQWNDRIKFHTDNQLEDGMNAIK